MANPKKIWRTSQRGKFGITVSHTTVHQRPEEKMGRMKVPSTWHLDASQLTSSMRGIVKKSARKKRRQRDSRLDD